LYGGGYDLKENYSRTDTLKLLIPAGKEIQLFEYWDNMFRVWARDHTGKTFNRYTENGGIVAVVNPDNELSAAFFPDNQQDRYNGGKFKLVPPKAIIDSIIKRARITGTEYTSIASNDYSSVSAYKLKNLSWEHDRRTEALIKDLTGINMGKLLIEGTKSYWGAAKELGMDKSFKQGLAQ